MKYFISLGVLIHRLIMKIKKKTRFHLNNLTQLFDLSCPQEYVYQMIAKGTHALWLL